MSDFECITGRIASVRGGEHPDTTLAKSIAAKLPDFGKPDVSWMDACGRPAVRHERPTPVTPYTGPEQAFLTKYCP